AGGVLVVSHPLRYHHTGIFRLEDSLTVPYHGCYAWTREMGTRFMRLYDRLRLHGGDWPEIPVIIADNILKQIDGMLDNRQSPWDIGETPPAASYGCVAPPFEQFFVEADAAFNGESIQRGGFCFQLKPNPEIAPPGTRWCLAITPWFYMHGEVISCQASALIHTDANGHILDDMKRLRVAETAAPHPSLLPSTQAAH